MLLCQCRWATCTSVSTPATGRVCDSVAVANLLRQLILRWAYFEYTSICCKRRLQMSTKIPNSDGITFIFPFSVFFYPCAFPFPFLISFNSSFSRSDFSSSFMSLLRLSFFLSRFLSYFFVSSFFVTSSSFIYSFFPHPHSCFLLSIFLF